MTSPFPANPALIAAKASICDLHAAVKARMLAVAGKYSRFETADANVKRAPSVIDGWLPPKAGADDHQFPFIIVRPRTGTETEQSADQNATVGVDIVIGTYSDTDDGWLDVLLLIDAVRVDLGEAPSIAGTAFEMTGPLTWEIPEEQPRPQWLGTVKTIWTVPRPQRVDARNPVGG